VLGDEVLVVPALFDDVGKQGVQERRVRARLDVEVKHVVLAGDLLGDATVAERRGSTMMSFADAADAASAGNNFFFLSKVPPVRLGTQWFRK